MGVNQLGGQFRNKKISSPKPTLFETVLSFAISLTAELA
jgi:hypothetical protein